MMTGPFRTFELSSPEFSPPDTRFLTVQSPALRRRGDIVIYNAETTTPDVPAVTLLHGVYGSAWAWMYAGGVHTVYERLRAEGLSEFVLLMPSDGLPGDGSGYYARDDADYRAWITDDVRTAAVLAVPGLTESSRHYICGLSMGGYGALRLAALEPTIYSGASAHSPITTAADFDAFTDTNPADGIPDTDLADLVTSRAGTMPPFRFDCGQADTLFPSAQRLHDSLTNADVPHEFEPLEGSHNWPYWTRNVGRSLSFFDKLERQQSTR